MTNFTKDTLKVIATMVVVVFTIGYIGYGFGHIRGREAQRPIEEIRVTDIIEETIYQSGKIYDDGFDAGEQQGFQEGYATCYQGLGMNWLGHYKRFMDFQQEYGSIHNTPWAEFTIEEKVTIAMYGGSGSKLEPEEIEEWVGKYGIQKEAKGEEGRYTDYGIVTPGTGK